MKYNVLLALAGLTMAAGALANPTPAPVPADPAKGKLIAEQICAACHGVDGNSVAAANPVLAGQHPDYIVKQLTEFKSGKRNNAIMLGMASTLSDQDMKNVAAWFGTQKPKAREAQDPKTMEAGRAIYRTGIASAKVPACMACHGPAGNGMPSQYPRVGSQFGSYIEAQMLAFKKGERANNPIMTDIAKRMSDNDIKTVSNYISGLR
ncbi:cytochrome c4 [Laribacter hongkongensis]|uniref:Cyc n=2 Tax=Laribacter hongkongensis TaxID=168471 RepID=C1D5Q7_LARHH|nr:c-type cytochrome [Laribacter hongkongensis]ACO76074.1 Cyc [Laribacter hongkongensis HLHK9]ASJ26114.1 cytochrome c [Laribacter hongkongensis]MBE5529601.1 cytochrome C [Laribacter hongkongensis]MCG8992175.1 cytochrome c4 [Laribacter hongkongensis]MCG8995216.1 cytochrome c4 [Laribacter hongkongensis]